jgi:hypothetical protein
LTDFTLGAAILAAAPSRLSKSEISNPWNNDVETMKLNGDYLWWAEMRNGFYGRPG